MQRRASWRRAHSALLGLVLLSVGARGVAVAQPMDDPGPPAGGNRLATADARRTWKEVCRGAGHWGSPAPFQVVVWSPSEPGTQAPLHESLSLDLEDYQRRRAAGDRAVPLFDGAGAGRLQAALFPADRAQLAGAGRLAGGAPAVEGSASLTPGELRAKLGLEPLPGADGGAFPAWMCTELRATGAAVGLVAFVDAPAAGTTPSPAAKGAVQLRLVLADPCVPLGAREALQYDPRTDRVSSVADALSPAARRLLDRWYWTAVRPDGPGGVRVYVGEELVGPLPMDTPFCVAPGINELVARGAQGELEHRTVGLEPGDHTWGVAGAVVSHGRRFTWVALGAGAGLLAAGATLHWLGNGWEAQARPDEAGTRSEAADLRDQARGAKTGANVAYGLSAAALVAGAVLWFWEPEWSEPSPTSAFVAPIGGGGFAVGLRGAY